VFDDARRDHFGGGIKDTPHDTVDRQMIGDDTAAIDAFKTPPLVGIAMLEEVPPGNAVFVPLPPCSRRLEALSQWPQPGVP
jgi:hypothetical protein